MPEQHADIELIHFDSCRCRTCRKRKTRCDGKKPLCSTCTDNGHECLGYANVGEGNTRSESGDNFKREYDGVIRPDLASGDEGENHENMNKGRDSFSRETKNGHSQPPLSRSPQHRRVDAKGSGFFDPNLNGGKERVVRVDSIRTYRDNAVFSDEGPDQLGIDTPILSKIIF
jgi:hypothetical protein